jgi:hypothetical protein
MRPLLGKKFDLTGIDDVQEETGSIIPYPNPLSGDLLSFQVTGKYRQSDPGSLKLSIYNMLGSRVYESTFSPSVNIGNLTPGIYIIRITEASGNIVSVAKLVKK